MTRKGFRKIITVSDKTKSEFDIWKSQAKTITGLPITQDQFVSFLLTLYAEHVEKVSKEQDLAEVVELPKFASNEQALAEVAKFIQEDE